MAVDDVLDDRQTQAGAAALAAALDVHTIEALGEPRDVFAGNTLTFVLDCYKYLTGGGIRLPEADSHVRAFASIFDRVVDQILKDLSEFIALANDA